MISQTRRAPTSRRVNAGFGGSDGVWTIVTIPVMAAAAFAGLHDPANVAPGQADPTHNSTPTPPSSTSPPTPAPTPAPHRPAATPALLPTPARLAPARLVPVDPIWGDTGPLAVSNAVMPTDLRSPLDFDRVFQLRSDDGRSGAFVRQNGGLSAVFPRSSYVATPYGAYAMVPAGTVYVLGDPTDSGAMVGFPTAQLARSPGPTAARIGDARPLLLTAPAQGEAMARPDTRANVALSARGAIAADLAVPAALTAGDGLDMWSSELFRRGRLAALLADARPEAASRAHPTARAPGSGPARPVAPDAPWSPSAQPRPPTGPDSR